MSRHGDLWWDRQAVTDTSVRLDGQQHLATSQVTDVACPDDPVPDQLRKPTVLQVTCRVHRRQAANVAASDRNADIQGVVVGEEVHAVACQQVVEGKTLSERHAVACDLVLDHAHGYRPMPMASATVPCGTRSSSGNDTLPRSSFQSCPTSSGWLRDLPLPVLSTAEKWLSKNASGTFDASA